MYPDKREIPISNNNDKTRNVRAKHYLAKAPSRTRPIRLRIMS